MKKGSNFIIPYLYYPSSIYFKNTFFFTDRKWLTSSILVWFLPAWTAPVASALLAPCPSCATILPSIPSLPDSGSHLCTRDPFCLPDWTFPCSPSPPHPCGRPLGLSWNSICSSSLLSPLPIMKDLIAFITFFNKRIRALLDPQGLAHQRHSAHTYQMNYSLIIHFDIYMFACIFLFLKFLQYLFCWVCTVQYGSC